MNTLSPLSDEELISRLDSVSGDFEPRAALDELIERYKNKKLELAKADDLVDDLREKYDDLKKIELLRIRRQVQLHSRNMDLKEQIYKALQALSPPSSQI